MSFDCIKCNFHGKNKQQLKIHLKTKKHINRDNPVVQNMYTYLYYRENHETIKRQAKINYYKTRGKEIRFIKINT